MEIFDQFDRLILLQDGYQMYQGNIKDIIPYLNSVNIVVPRFKSIAEFVIKMAQAPQMVRFGLT